MCLSLIENKWFYLHVVPTSSVKDFPYQKYIAIRISCEKHMFLLNPLGFSLANSISAR